MVNVGAGQGAYEPRDREVTAVEPEPAMIAARVDARGPGVAEALPFADDAFDAAMAVLTIHHWTRLARRRGGAAPRGARTASWS